MKIVNNTVRIMMVSLALVSLLGVWGCGSDDDDDDDDATPAAPTLSTTQIDRSGRAAVSTALIKSMLFADEADQTDTKNAYNADANQAGWAAAHATQIKIHLAVLDSLDGTCGNQLAADQGVADGTHTRYQFLSEVLADDRLYLNGASGTCNTYLAVESAALGNANTDCGGRTPLYDVIDTTYAVAATGGAAAVTDGNGADDKTHTTTTFPFLAAP